MKYQYDAFADNAIDAGTKQLVHYNSFRTHNSSVSCITLNIVNEKEWSEIWMFKYNEYIDIVWTYGCYE